MKPKWQRARIVKTLNPSENFLIGCELWLRCGSKEVVGRCRNPFTDEEVIVRPSFEAHFTFGALNGRVDSEIVEFLARDESDMGAVPSRMPEPPR